MTATAPRRANATTANLTIHRALYPRKPLPAILLARNGRFTWPAGQFRNSVQPEQTAPIQAFAGPCSAVSRGRFSDCASNFQASTLFSL